MEIQSDRGGFADHPLAPRVGPPSAHSPGHRPTLGAAMNALDWRQAVGGALVAIGTLAILIAWWQISGTPYPGEQMPPLASGGLGGAALIAIGVLLLNSFEHVKDREALAEVLARLEAFEARSDRTNRQILDELERLQSAASRAEATEPSRPARRATRSGGR